MKVRVLSSRCPKCDRDIPTFRPYGNQEIYTHPFEIEEEYLRKEMVHYLCQTQVLLELEPVKE